MPTPKIEMRGAIASALAVVCSDGNSDVKRVVDDVIACLGHAGFAIVPADPTREMWAAGGDAVVTVGHVHHDRIVEAVWTDMLAAAPAGI